MSALTRVVFTPSFFHAEAALWLVAYHRMQAEHGMRLRQRSVFMKYVNVLFENLWYMVTSKQAHKHTLARV